MTITINGNGTVTGISVGGLPDGIVDTDMLANLAVSTGKIANSAVTAAKSSGLGISEVDQWCVSSDHTIGSSGWHVLNANWQRPTGTTAADGTDLGTGLTQSSGVFTFPSTGFWLVTYHATGYNSSHRQFWQIDIQTAAGASLAESQTSIIDQGSSDWYESQACSCIMDITDTSADAGKVNFRVYADGSMNIDASGSQQRTGAHFIKLADT